MFLRYAAACSLFVLAMLFLPESSQAQTEPQTEAQTEAPPEKKEKGAMVRIVCVQSLSGDKDEEITLAQKTEDGKWIESGDLTLRSPCITDWVRVPFGPNNLVRKGDAEPVSLGSFTISPDMKGAILILIPDLVKQIYRLQVIDPAKLEFRKGKALIVNYSKMPALVNMGKETKTVAPGQQLVETIKTDANSMHRMLIAYLDKDKNVVPCYDRFVSANPNTRKFIMLFPDRDTGLRAMSLSEFGPFE
jgi:hypothetical protein